MEKKEVQLFRKYVDNLEIVKSLLSNEPVITDHAGQPVKTNEPLYLCPLCTDLFTEEALGERRLTLEHVPPKSLGGSGKGNLLTCKSCNNNQGSRLESKLAETLKSKNGIKAKVSTGNSSAWITCQLTIQKDKPQISLLYDKPKTKKNPYQYFEALRARNPTENFRVKVTYPKPELLDLARLRVAYLTMFQSFGYIYYFSQGGFYIRNLLERVQQNELPLFRLPTIPEEIPKGIYHASYQENPRIEGLLVSMILQTSEGKEATKVLLPYVGKNALERYKALMGRDKSNLTLHSIPDTEQYLYNPKDAHKKLSGF